MRKLFFSCSEFDGFDLRVWVIYLLKHFFFKSLKLFLRNDLFFFFKLFWVNWLTVFYKIELFEGFRFLEILFGRIASNLFLASQIICSSFFPRRPSTSGFCCGLWHFVFWENLSPFLVLWEGNLLFLCLEFTET